MTVSAAETGQVLRTPAISRAMAAMTLDDSTLENAGIANMRKGKHKANIDYFTSFPLANFANKAMFICVFTQ